ncbi:MAG: hypothetical protein QW356_02095 [Candidatus Hadarchaeales archaeon]
MKKLNRRRMIDFIVGRVMRKGEIPDGLGLNTERLFRDWLLHTNVCEMCDVYQEKVGNIGSLIEDGFCRLDGAGKLKILLAKNRDGVRDALREKLEALSDEEVLEIYAEVLGKEL